MPRVGVFGGTFNPVHLGHIQIALRTQRLFGLDSIQFVVATCPPHKSPDGIVPFVHRYAMVALATSVSKHLVPSTVELEAPASPFSIDTMSKLARKFGRGVSLHFIAGGDSLNEIGTWRGAGELLSRYNFIFVVRPGVPVPPPGSLLPAGIRCRVDDLRGLPRGEVRARLAAERRDVRVVRLVDVDAPDISASSIRELAHAGRRYKHMVHPLVCQYITKLQLYGEQWTKR